MMVFEPVWSVTCYYLWWMCAYVFLYCWDVSTRVYSCVPCAGLTIREGCEIIAIVSFVLVSCPTIVLDDDCTKLSIFVVIIDG